MILHTLNAHSDSSAFNDCFALCHTGDALLLIGDGVYAVLNNATALSQMQALGVELCALASDLDAAGIHCESGPVGAIDVDGFVQLTERYTRQMAWY